MEEKNKMLTIGQFAALHGINKKTLMWYDEIGLFKPAVIDPVNGYRYYNYHQSAELETILLMRELEVAISDIQKFMANRSAANFASLLNEKITEVEQHIAHLKAVQKTLNNYRQNMLTLLTMDLSAISIVNKKGRSLITITVNDDMSFDKEVEIIAAEAKKYQLRRLHDAYYGAMIAVERLYQGNFDQYSHVFMEMPFPVQKTGLHSQPSGKYLRAFYKGNWQGISQKYQEILDYAQQQGLTLTGFSYEMGINENVIDHIDDYITQIEIPIAE